MLVIMTAIKFITKSIIMPVIRFITKSIVKSDVIPNNRNVIISVMKLIIMFNFNSI